VPMLRPFLGCVLLLTLGFLRFSQAQETSTKPDSPTPKKIEAPIPRPHKPSRTPWEKSAEPEMVADLPALATSIAAHISATGCQPKSWTILVTNFTLPDGNTSAYGMQLADTLSRELTNKEYKLCVIERNTFLSFLSTERVPVQPDRRAATEWISEVLDSRFMVFGTTEKIGDDQVTLSSQLVDTTSKDWRVFNGIVRLGPLNPGENLEPIDPLPPLPPITSTASGEMIQPAGVDGTTPASCFYMPNPPYSEDARKVKLSGVVTAEAVVNTKGRLENIRIVRGVPAGLNETTIATMRSWRCHPALKDGKPVSVLAQFTVNFRLY
jgi:TonB family protein